MSPLPKKNSDIKKLDYFDYFSLNEETLKNEQSFETYKRSLYYTELMDLYVSSAKRNLIAKFIFKLIFFIISISCLIFIIFLFFCSMKYAFICLNSFDNLNDIDFESILGIFTILLPALSSLIVAFLKIPEIIAQYLFNIEEESYMSSIIKNIQDYDTGMYELQHKVDKLISENKEQSMDDLDNEIDSLYDEIDSLEDEQKIENNDN